jgi:hypothetical protein
MMAIDIAGMPGLRLDRLEVCFLEVFGIRCVWRRCQRRRGDAGGMFLMNRIIGSVASWQLKVGTLLRVEKYSVSCYPS